MKAENSIITHPITATVVLMVFSLLPFRSRILELSSAIASPLIASMNPSMEIVNSAAVLITC